ncbi:MAG TPA: FAD-dependent oxidoreductase [Acidimicrobiales bacterium]|nr:FAD-dependent oxidoreductase [Acidimicrobiales bacterium]
MRRSVTIVGASLAGIRGAEALRRDGFDGNITLIGDEPRPPYDRPPLSKQVLAGTWEPERTALLTDEALADLDLDLRLGRRAAGLDLGARAIALDDGEVHGFDGLLIATGASPRTIPGATGLEGVYTLRTLDDCLAIRRTFDATPGRVVVVGAGFIGAEVAATARVRGLDVTLIEALPVPLGRVLGDMVGSVCGEVHRDHGVDLRVGVGVDGLDGTGRVERVRLSDGQAIDADVVIVGVGVAPNTGWLEGSGLTLDNGVVCDATALAAPGVTAAGDVARWPNLRFAETMRVEHWDHAIEMGAHAARRLLQSDDEAAPFAPVPFFWSDQYDRKIQLAGRAHPDDDVEVVAGSFEERRFVALYGRNGRVVGVLGFNRPRQVMQYRQLIVDRASWDDALAFAAAQAS